MDLDVKDLEKWEEKILEKVHEFGLVCYPQDFEICDHLQMIGYMAYSGMPSHYPHWSYGKSYEKLKTLYDYGVSGLPYEMVINSNPALAYLMRDNTLCLQLLTIAHVYGHNDFFANNFTLKTTQPENVIARCKIHARRVRGYIENPSIGIEKVERILDAAHALAHQCRRNLASPKLTREQELARLYDRFRIKEDLYGQLHEKEKFDEEGYESAKKKNPIEPDEDILLFIRDNNHYLSEWEKDLLTIVHEEAQYFTPNIETKTMNEGWASYWHREIMNSLSLPQDIHLEFLVNHSQVVRPHPGGYNPYHVGLTMYDWIRIWYDGSLDYTSLLPTERTLYDEMKHDYEDRGIESECGGKMIIGPPGTGRKTGREKLFEIRTVDRDTSFFRQYLTPPIMRALGLFKYEPKDENHIVVTDVVDGVESWKKIRDVLITNTGMGQIPVIKVEDANFEDKRILSLKHSFDGRELLDEYTENTLRHVQTLWGQEVRFETIIGGKKFVYNFNGTAMSKK